MSVPTSEGIPIDPMWARGYAVVRGAWQQVFWLPSGAIQIDSGKPVQVPLRLRLRLRRAFRTRVDPEWRVWCPASRGTSIALYRLSDTGQFRRGGEATLRDLLAHNPRYLVGQTVGHEGTTWRVASAERTTVRLEDDAGRIRDASSKTVVGENL